MRRGSAVAVLVVVLSAVSWAGNFVKPTTTLSAQMNNNTSAANSFPALSDGNLGAGNVSKVDVHSLLYPGATTKIYAHLLLWFGGTNHINVGYSSTDPNQVHRQITDMISRGIDGVIIDWYGPGNSIDQATQLVMAEAEKHPGFTFAIMVDQGAIEWDSCSGCTPQQALIEQLQYIERTYVPSPAYMRIDGAPVVTNFNIDLSFSVNWNEVNAALATQPKFIFQNNNGFTHTLSDGSYSWVMPTTNDYGMGYLSSFYATGMSYESQETVGAAYKGFNDTLASWGSNRIMGQQCGQTWLQTFAKINSLYNSGKPLPYLQLVTWNDYEEGTEIESGIDDCVSVSASVSDNGLTWKNGGSESAVDHYTIYISNDGQNLMPLGEEAAGDSSLNLCSFPVPPGNYKLFVQAVGKPSFANRITGAIGYTSTCGVSGENPGGISLVASPANQTIQAGQTASFTISAAGATGDLSNPIALSCANLPSALNCSFAPNAINGGGSSSTLTISVVSGAGAQAGYSRSGLTYALWLFPFGLAGIVVGGKPRRRLLQCIVFVCAAGLTLTLGSCGGARSSGGAANSSYAITVNGSSGAMQLSTVITVSVP